MSGQEGSCMALWSAKGTCSRISRLRVRSKAAQPPASFCMASNQGMQRQAGVPDGGVTGLDADLIALLDEEVAKVLLGFEDARVVIAIAQGAEDDQDVDHGREDRAQALGVFEVFEEPFLGLFDGL